MPTYSTCDCHARLSCDDGGIEAAIVHRPGNPARMLRMFVEHAAGAPSVRSRPAR